MFQWSREYLTEDVSQYVSSILKPSFILKSFSFKMTQNIIVKGSTACFIQKTYLVTWVFFLKHRVKHPKNKNKHNSSAFLHQFKIKNVVFAGEQLTFAGRTPSKKVVE